MQSISEMTNSALRGNVLERLSGQIRENPSAIKRGLEQAIPASMAGLSSYASSEQNAEELLGGLRGGKYPQMEADDVQDMVNDPAATARMTQSSSGLIGQIFGGRQTAVVDAIAKQSGLTRSGASTVLGLATPLVLSAVSRETEERHLDARGLSRMLGDEGRNASSALPGSVAGALGVGAIGVGAIGMARGATTGTPEEGRGVGERAREEGRGLGDRARGAAHEARGAAHEARESISERLHRARHTTATTGEGVPETERRKGFGWKLAAIAVAAIAALFLFSRRNATPEMPKVSTPETPQATAPKVTAPQEQPAQPQAAQPQAAQPPEGTQPQAAQPQAAQPQEGAQPQAAPPQAAQPQAEQQQGAQPPEGAQQPQEPQEQGEQPSAQQAAPEEGAAEQPAASPTEPSPEQPAGVAAEPLSEGTGAAPLSALLDGDATLPKRFELESVKFETGSTDITSNPVLDEVADVLEEHPEASVRLDGYTDATGDPAANEALSTARADAVKDYLVEQGVAEDAIETSGMATERPIASNDTAQGKAENRRVELVVTAR